MNNAPLASQGSKYTDDIRLQAIGAYVVTGSQTATAKETNIPRTTISQWSKQEWWLRELVKVRHEKQDELDAQLTGYIEKAFKSVGSRLDKGDAYIKKDGKIGYKPVSCRDSATVGGIMYDKRALLRNMPTTITANTGSDKLLKLQAKFEELVNHKTKEIEATIVAEG